MYVIVYIGFNAVIYPLSDVEDDMALNHLNQSTFLPAQINAHIKPSTVSDYKKVFHF